MRQMESSFLQNPHVSETVAITTNYASDSRICLTTHTSIPIDLARIIGTRIINPLRNIDPKMHYFTENTLHITINNIRVINDPPHFGPSEIAKVKELLTNLIPNFRPFQFVLHGLLRMPTSISVIALITPEYNDFIKTLRQQLIDIGVPDDKKYFSGDTVFANSTICRFTHTPSVAFMNEVEKHLDESFGIMTSDELSLVSTNAGFFPEKTTVFGTYRFSQNRG